MDGCPVENGVVVFKNNGGKPIKIYDQEEITPEEIEVVSQKVDCTAIIVIRDIYNMLASMLRWEKERNGIIGRHESIRSTKIRLDRWVNFADEVLSPTFNHTDILFNKWFTDDAYRESICLELGLEFTDKGKQAVAGHGGGSSFDRREFNGKADQMDVLNRYKSYADDPLFNSLISEEMHEKCHALFDVPFFGSDIK